MTDSLRSELLGTSGLTIAALAAVWLTVCRRPLTAGEGRRSGPSTIFALLVGLQACHFVEEYATGFHDRFPPVLGLAPWPAEFFLAFNVAWLVAWSVALVGMRAGYRVAFFPAWFLALAGMVNGLAHPLLALQARAYFPGLLTSPLVGLAGLVLWNRLMAATESEDMRRRARDLLPFR
jgi:Protein of unknown function with HXXEE motif